VKGGTNYANEKLPGHVQFFFDLIALLKDPRSIFEIYPEEKSLFLPLILKVAGGVQSGNPVQKLRARISLNGG